MSKRRQLCQIIVTSVLSIALYRAFLGFQLGLPVPAAGDGASASQALVTSSHHVVTQNASRARDEEAGGDMNMDYPPVPDQEIDPKKEEERCRRYGFGYDGRTHRRRVFLGGLIADDSWHPLQAVAAEGYGIYHSVSFIESNLTQNKNPRTLRFSHQSNNLRRLKSLYGPSTRVTVDQVYLNGPERGLKREDMMREYILHRWKINGMNSEDIGIVADTDETFTRDFLRAAQICDIPMFRPGQNCQKNKIMSKTMVFEMSPDCITQSRLWYHPDMTLGECLIFMGNEETHKPAKRQWDRYREVFDPNELSERRKNGENFPLTKAQDVRMMGHGTTGVALQEFESFWAEARKKTSQPVHYTGYHFHNFFENTTTLRNKMATYGHPHPHAWRRPLGALHDDIQLGINCIMNRSDTAGHPNVKPHVAGGLDSIVGPVPIFFANATYRQKRNEHLRKIILEDEKTFGRGTKDATPVFQG